MSGGNLTNNQRVELLMSYQKTPLVCSYIGAPCEHVGTAICSDRSTITCRNIRQKNEKKENHHETA